MEESRETPRETSLEVIRALVQRDSDSVNKLLEQRKTVVLAAHELQDVMKMTNAYKEMVEQNTKTIDLIVDIKQDIFKIKLAILRFDRTTDLGLKQQKQSEEFIKMLNDLLGILKEEKEKMDRIVRFYERNYNSYVTNY